MKYKDIKFRGWYSNKMFNVLKIDFSTDDVYLEDPINFDSKWVSVDEVELMMYIGEQDKNGEDIYEGDIVLATEIDGFDWQFERGTKSISTSITIDLSTEISTVFSGGVDTKIRYEDVEIIGNKHENPELL